jgi:hypothetical protein
MGPADLIFLLGPCCCLVLFLVAVGGAVWFFVKKKDDPGAGATFAQSGGLSNAPP